MKLNGKSLKTCIAIQADQKLNLEEAKKAIRKAFDLPEDAKGLQVKMVQDIISSKLLAI